MEPLVVIVISFIIIVSVIAIIFCVNRKFNDLSCSAKVQRTANNDKEMKHQYLKAQRQIQNDFFQAGRQILNKTAQTVMQEKIRSCNRTVHSQSPSKKYEGHSSSVSFDDFEEI